LRFVLGNHSLILSIYVLCAVLVVSLSLYSSSKQILGEDYVPQENLSLFKLISA